jgi:glycosyltransferase involved in cell wall biosynthesis
MTTSPYTPLPLSALPDTPLVSVLVANYNYARFLPEALGGLRQQSYERIEVIVCDDGSTDDSLVVLRGLAAKDTRVRFVAKENGGVASALNAAFAESRGELVCLLDADDVFYPEKVARLVAFARSRPAAGLFLHGMDVVDEARSRLRRIDPSGSSSQGWIADDVLRRGGRWRGVPASGLALRREVAARLFPLPDAELRSVADGYLLTLAPLLTEVAAFPDVLAVYRLHGHNLTGVRGVSAGFSARYREGLARILRAANAWLDVHRPDAPRFRVSDHLNDIEHRRWQTLLGQADEPVGAWRFAVAIVRDDLYRSVRKWAGLIAGVGGVVIPRRWRASWLAFWLNR